MQQLCHCRSRQADTERVMYVLEGVPVCNRECMQRIDAAVIAEQCDYRDMHGLAAMRAREQARTPRNLKIKEAGHESEARSSFS